jgi:hypothetical protein
MEKSFDNFPNVATPRQLRKASLSSDKAFLSFNNFPSQFCTHATAKKNPAKRKGPFRELTPIHGAPNYEGKERKT